MPASDTLWYGVCNFFFFFFLATPSLFVFGERHTILSTFQEKMCVHGEVIILLSIFSFFFFFYFYFFVPFLGTLGTIYARRTQKGGEKSYILSTMPSDNAVYKDLPSVGDCQFCEAFKKKKQPDMYRHVPGDIAEGAKPPVFGKIK